MTCILKKLDVDGRRRAWCEWALTAAVVCRHSVDYTCIVRKQKNNEGDKSLTKSTQSVMFEVSSLCMHTSSKSSAPLINSHVDSQLFKVAPAFNQPLFQFGVNRWGCSSLKIWGPKTFTFVQFFNDFET